MSVDHIRYDVLVQQALRQMVRNILEDVARTKALPGEHHFFITFDTTIAGVGLSPRLRAQYPSEMTVVLQHQFRDLRVNDEGFEVGLSFGGISERLRVPFDSVKSFADPSVQFTLQFETLGEAANDGDSEGDGETDVTEADEPKLKPVAAKPSRIGSVPATPLPMVRPAATDGDAAAAPPAAPDGKPGAEVVRLDRFRKK